MAQSHRIFGFPFRQRQHDQEQETVAKELAAVDQELRMIDIISAYLNKRRREVIALYRRLIRKSSAAETD